jgi:hypothetical protein
MEEEQEEEEEEAEVRVCKEQRYHSHINQESVTYRF